jgi:hypothetical protein
MKPKDKDEKARSAPAGEDVIEKDVGHETKKAPTVSIWDMILPPEQIDLFAPSEFDDMLF